MMNIFGTSKKEKSVQPNSRVPLKEEDEEIKRKEEESEEDGIDIDDEDELDELLDEDGINERPEWQQTRVRNARPPHPLTVTHVNHTQDLMRVKDLDAVHADSQNSEEWLKSHSIDFLALSPKDLINKGRIAKLTADHQTGKAQQHIQFEAYDVNEFEYKLNIAIENYTKRIKWLLRGSKRIFGHLRGKKTAVCIDTSDANTGFGRLTAFQESLLHLLDEQLSEKESIYLLSFGTEIEPLWSIARDVNCRVIEEAKEWVMHLQQRGGCNVLKAMKHILKVKDIDSICIVLGSVPDQSSDLLCDFTYQMSVGRDIPLHTVAYDCSNHLTNITLRNLAEASNGRYHCYTATCEEQIYTGTDISMLLREIQRAQDVINKIKEMRQGMMGSALVSIMNEISTEVSKLPQSRFLPRPPGHDSPLKLETPKFNPMSSEDWLKLHGLRAKKLDLYQILAPNSYSYKEDFIPVIKKAVQSQVHEKAMVQFTWHDGSIKNVHVDMTQLFEYQKQLGATVGLFEKRIDWLSTGSRRILGTVVEKNVIIMVDLSVSNVNYLVHLQHSLRLLLEQQMPNKDYFNIIGFGSKIVSWKTTMVKPTPENLEKAWRWILELQCNGSRNFLGAFKMAVENEEEVKHGIYVQGIYLLTSGVPDQSQDVAMSYIEEACLGREVKVHTVLFNVDDYDSEGAIPGRYANITTTAECLRIMSHCSDGRFHWFRETGIIENDDIQCVTAEIDRALNFSRKCAMLVDLVKKKHQRTLMSYSQEIRMLSSCEGATKPLLSAKRSTSLTRTHQDESSLKAITYRPSSASSSRESGTTPPRQRPSSAKDPMQRVKKSTKKVSTSVFFLDDKHSTGSIFTKYPNVKSVRKRINHPTLPDTEDACTMKEWMRLYSLSRLKLDLYKMAAGPDCRHEEKTVKSLHRNVAAKYCTIFPSVNIKGTIKHLQLLPNELQEYVVQVERILRRYLKRLQWLLSGSRRVFGCVVHKKCVFLIDNSGSMVPSMEELKRELASLIWDQLYKMRARFNMISFSAGCEKWRDHIQPASEENCHDAVRWASRFVATGNTCTLEAIELAFEDPDIEAIYLLSDGKPDTSTSLVLREVARLNADRQIQINTISFNCEDSTANSFLKLLAAETGGRYHRCHGDFDAQIFAHKLLTEDCQDVEYPHLPEFEGDDLRRLGTEINQARKFISQARIFKSMATKEQKPNGVMSEKPVNGKVPIPFTVGRPRTAVI